MSAGTELLQFGAKIGVERDQITGAESIRDLHLIVDRPAKLFATLETADYERLMAQMGNALSLQIGLPNLPPLLNIDAGQLRFGLADAVKALGRMDEALLLRLNLSAAKGPLLAHWGLNGGDHYLMPFLYIEGFTRLLSAGLLTLDKHLFAAPDRATLVVLEDSDIKLTGSLLNVAGLRGAKQIADGAPPLSGRMQRRLQNYRATASKALSWSGFQLQKITPAHFLVADQPASGKASQRVERSGIANPQSQLQNLLAMQALSAAVLFTANRSMAVNDDFEAVYASSDNRAVIHLPAFGTAEPDLTALARWSLWPFVGNNGERLAILQNVAVRELPGADGEKNYAVLAAHLGHILDEARWHYRVFIDRQIEGHYLAEQEVNDTVRSVSVEIATAIDSLTQGFVNAAMGAVVVFLLSLLAALLANARPELLFRAGMVAYAVYLLLFPGIYRMGSQLHDFLLLRSETADRRTAYEQRLGRSRVAAAQAGLAAREQQFWIWFVITGILFLLVSLMLLFLAGWLPGRLGPLS